MAVEEIGCVDNVLVEEGSADDVLVVEEEGSADAPEEPCLPVAIGPKLYSLTKSMDWTVLKNGQPGRPIAPVPYTGGNEFFSVKMDFEKVKGMVDAFQPLVMSISGSKGTFLHDVPHGTAQLETAVLQT